MLENILKAREELLKAQERFRGLPVVRSCAQLTHAGLRVGALDHSQVPPERGGQHKAELPARVGPPDHREVTETQVHLLVRLGLKQGRLVPIKRALCRDIIFLAFAQTLYRSPE